MYTLFTNVSIILVYKKAIKELTQVIRQTSAELNCMIMWRGWGGGVINLIYSVTDNYNTIDLRCGRILCYIVT